MCSTIAWLALFWKYYRVISPVALHPCLYCTSLGDLKHFVWKVARSQVWERKISPKFSCTKFFCSVMDVCTKSLCSCAPSDGVKVFGSGRPPKYPPERRQDIPPKEFMLAWLPLQSLVVKNLFLVQILDREHLFGKCRWHSLKRPEKGLDFFGHVSERFSDLFWRFSNHTSLGKYLVSSFGA